MHFAASLLCRFVSRTSYNGSDNGGGGGGGGDNGDGDGDGGGGGGDNDIYNGSDNGDGGGDGRSGVEERQRTWLISTNIYFITHNRLTHWEVRLDTQSTWLHPTNSLKGSHR